MEINFDEMKNILSVFIDANTPYITLRELGFFDKNGREFDSLLFHFNLLAETGLISDRRLQTGDPCLLGLVFTSAGIQGRNLPIRLTMTGHDFAKALNQKPILERVKKELSDAPFELVKNVAGQWLSQLLKDKLGLE